MAGMFYSLQEAAEKLNLTEEQLKEFVQEGKLREFRDGPNLLFKVDEVEALIPEFEAPEPEAFEPEAPEPEIAVPEVEVEEEPVELDISEPEAEEGTEVELEIPEPAAEEPEAVELEAPEPEVPEVEISEPEAEVEEPVELEDISELEALSDSDVPSLEDLEEEMAEVDVEEPIAEEPVVEEVVPEAQRGGNTDLATMGGMGGFAVMMLLDVALG